VAIEIVLFNAAAPVAFAPSKPLLMSADKFTVDFDIVVPAAGGPSKLEWFLEFATDDPLDAGTRWAREVAEEDVGAGVTDMPDVVRNFSALPDGTSHKSAQFIRAHRFVRIQLQLAAGLISQVTIRAPFGVTPARPV
jgi:hypothetical protein